MMKRPTLHLLLSMLALASFAAGCSLVAVHGIEAVIQISVTGENQAQGCFVEFAVIAIRISFISLCKEVLFL